MTSASRRGLLISAVLLVLPLAANAQILEIRPALVDSSAPVEKALSENRGRASTSLEVKGKALRITYASNEAIEVYMVPVTTEGSFVPTDFIRFTLPQTDEGTVEIDLTVSPGWTPKTQRWILHLLTKNEGAEAGFLDVQSVPSSALSIAVAGVRHFLSPEPYTPSSYHALRGYRIFRFPFTVFFGIGTLIVSFAVLLKSKRKIFALLITLFVFHSAYQLRAGVDLLRFTVQHLSEYADGTYDEAGSIHAVASVLSSIATPDDSVYVCRDGTNYKEKLLRYFAYPLAVSEDPSMAETATFALVMDKASSDWSLETKTVDLRSVQTLHCNDLSRVAEQISTFPDGTILYRLLP